VFAGTLDKIFHRIIKKTAQVGDLRQKEEILNTYVARLRIDTLYNYLILN